MSNVCDHGRLARQCEVCERDQEIAELRTALRQAKEAEAQAMALVLNHEGHIEKLAAENAGLRGALSAYQGWEQWWYENGEGAYYCEFCQEWDGESEDYIQHSAACPRAMGSDALSALIPLTAAVQAVVEAARHFRQHKGHETRRGFGEIEALHAAVDHLNTLLRPAPQPQGEEDEEGQGLIQEDPE